MNTHPTTPRARLPLALLALALILIALPLIGCVVWLAWQFAQLSETAAAVLRLTIFWLPIVGGMAGTTLAGLIAWRRWGSHVYIAQHHETQQIRARTQIAPLASSFHYHQQVESLVGEEQLALPPPIDVGPLSLEAWLRWVDSVVHTLFGGATGKGKTTTVKAVIAQRLTRGELVFAIDPHSSDWFGLPVAGGSSAEWSLLSTGDKKQKHGDDEVAESWEIIRALLAAFGEYQRRMGVREEYKKRTGRELPPGQFVPLTILIDEVTTIAELFPALWALFLKLLASGTRKVDMRFLLLAHSPNVDDLKISGALRTNFACIALDEPSCQRLIDGCRDKARQAALNVLLPDLDWPALASIDGKLMYLDRTGMDQLPEPLDASAQAWDGWDYTAGRAATPAPAQSPTEEPRGTQTLVSAGALLPTTIGGVRLSHMIAKMVERGRQLSEIGDVLASLVLRVAPQSDRAAIATEIARRAAAIAESGNALAIASQLSRDDLIAMCKSIGAGARIAYAIWGGNSKQFRAHANAANES